MSATAAIAAFGTLLKRAGTTLLQVTSLATPEKTISMIDATNMESPSGYEEFIAGIKTGGTVQVEFDWIPANATHQQLDTDAEAGTSAAWTIVFPGTVATTSFSARVEKLRYGGGDVRAKLTGSCTLRVTGPVTTTY